MYNVNIYNFKHHFHDTYTVNADDPVDARNTAIQRLVDETGHGYDENEIISVEKC